MRADNYPFTFIVSFQIHVIILANMYENSKSTFVFVLVLNTIRSFQVFVQIFVMRSGRPFNSTMTAVYFIFERGITRGDIGYASAAAYILFLILIIFSLIQFKLLNIKRA